MKIMQGDAYGIPMTIKLNGAAISPEDVEDVEITLGNTPKHYLGGGVTFDNGAWAYQLGQLESFRLRDQADVQVRVKLLDGTTVIGKKLHAVNIEESKSKEVL